MRFDRLNSRKLLLAGSDNVWLWLAIGAFALILLVVLYRNERQLVSQRAGLSLLGLRLLAALTLIVALFEPIATRTFRESLKGRVIVAVDNSNSMTTPDAGRPEDERKALATLLQLSPTDQLPSITRHEISRRLISASGPLSKLTADHAVEALTFSRGITTGSLDEIGQLLEKPTQPSDTAFETDPNPALGRALSNSEAPVLGVLLITDGRFNRPVDGRILDLLAGRGVPIYGIMTGSTVPTKDVAVAQIKAPDTVYVGDVATIDAVIKLDGVPAGEQVEVKLERPGSPPMTQAVVATSDGSRPTASFRVAMEAKGQVPLTVSVIPPTPDDLRSDNNTRTAVVQVADDKAQVLLVDGEARWEFRYLYNALKRDTHIQVDSIVVRQPISSLSTETTYPAGLPSASTDPKQADPLGNYDMIVLGDVDPADIQNSTWQRLEAFVADRGGTLVISPGPRFWPSGHESSAQLRALLPILNPTFIKYDEAAIDPTHPALPAGVRLNPTPEALADSSSWPMLQLGPDAGSIWSELPKLLWALGGRIKPGATVLVGGEKAEKPGDAAIIAAQSYGLGRVLWVGTDSTWRWRFGVGDTYHHAFWGQVVRWASAGGLVGGNRLVRFGPLKSRVAEGDPGKIQARFSEGVTGIGAGLLAVVKIFRDGDENSEPAAVIPLQAVTGQPRAYEGVPTTLPIGSYLMKLEVPELADQLSAESRPVEAQLEIVGRETSENVELTASRDALERLANTTGGEVLHDYEADKLLEKLKAKIKIVDKTIETSLWDGPEALLLFFAILTIEWTMRKRLGLP